MGSAVPVLVFGSGLTTLGVMRVLGRRGIPVFAVHPLDGGIRWSRWYRKAPWDAPDRASAAALVEYLRRLDLERAVLIGSSDDWVRCLAARDPSLAGRFHTSLPHGETIGNLVDKRGLAVALQAAGVPHPTTRVVESESDLELVAESPDTTFFLKPADSQRFGPTFEVKAFSVASLGDAAAKFKRARDAGFAMLLQEYVPGPASNHYFVDGFVDAAGMLRAAFARRRYRMYPRDFGNSSFMASVPAADVADAIAALRRLLAHVDYRGIFSAEFKRDQGSGVFKLLEVNVRPWWYVEFAARCGVDVCYMYYRDALAQAVDSTWSYRTDERLVHSWCDYNAWRERRRSGDRTWWGHWRAWLGSHRATFAWDDPLPAVSETLRAATRKVGLRGG